MTHRPADWPEAVYEFELAQALRDLGAGVRRLPDRRSRRHHFVPQFVLSGFTGDDKKLYQYDKTTRQGEPRTTNGVGHAPRLYGVKRDDGRYDNRIEEYLGLIEHHAAPAVRTLRAGEQPTDEELFNLACFFSMQIARTPDQLEAIGHTYQRLMTDALTFASSDPREWRRFLQTPLGARFEPPAGDTVEHQRLKVQATLATGVTPVYGGENRHLGLEVMTGSTVYNASMFLDAHWVFAESPGGGLTCNDRCLFRLVDVDRLPWTDSWGFPLAPDLCVIVHLNKRHGDLSHVRTQLDARLRERLNLRIYGWASQFIYAETQHVAQSTRHAAKQQPRRGRKPTPDEYNDG